MQLADPTRRGVTQVAPGRVLGWSAWGAETGTPILLSPGAATSSWLGLPADVIDALGVHLIAIDRPGLGRSTHVPGRTLEDFASDIQALAAAQGLVAPAIVGFSQGTPFALACAVRPCVSAVAIVAGTDELASPALRPRLAPPLGELVDLAERDSEAALAFFRGMTPAMMVEMIRSSSTPVDLAVYDAPEFAARFAAALAEGFSRGSEGYAVDTLLAMRPWGLPLDAITVPVQLWYGRQDGSPVHSPDLGESLARRLPMAERVVVEDGGGSLLWTHGARIVESLVAARLRSLGS